MIVNHCINCGEILITFDMMLCYECYTGKKQEPTKPLEPPINYSRPKKKKTEFPDGCQIQETSNAYIVAWTHKTGKWESTTIWKNK